MNPPDLLAKAAALMAKAGADQWELWAGLEQSLTLGVKDGQIDKYLQSDQQSLSLRLVKNNRLGFSYLTGGQAQHLPKMLEEALAAAAVGDERPGFTLAAPAPASVWPQVRDPQVDPRTAAGRLLPKALALAAAARTADDKVRHVHPAETGEAFLSSWLLNSQGLEQYQEHTAVWAMAGVVAGQDQEQEEGWDAQAACFWQDLDAEAIGCRAGRKAAGFLGAQPAPDGHYTVILTPEVTADFVRLLTASFMGDNVAKGRSLLAGRQGQSLFSPLLTLSDDGLYPRGLNSRAYDHEGTPQQCCPLIAEGVVKNFVCDRLWGQILGQPSTGNAARPAAHLPPRIGFKNLLLQPGQASQLQMIAGLAKGLVISAILGGHTADPVSGQFSFGLAGHLIENGQIIRPIRGNALAGKVMDLFAQVEAVGNDLEERGGAIVPSLCVRGLAVSGP